MTSATIPASSAQFLVTKAAATYKKKAAGFPKIDEDDLAEAMCIVQRGVTREQILTNDNQKTEARNLLREENTRRGFEKCLERTVRLGEFFSYLTASAKGPFGDAFVTISFDDWILLAKAEEADASDFN